MRSGIVDKGRTISQAAKAAGDEKFEAFLAGGLKAGNSKENGTHNGHLEEQKGSNAESSEARGATAGSGEAA